MRYTVYLYNSCVFHLSHSNNKGETKMRDNLLRLLLCSFIQLSNKTFIHTVSYILYKLYLYSLYAYMPIYIYIKHIKLYL